MVKDVFAAPPASNAAESEGLSKWLSAIVLVVWSVVCLLLARKLYGQTFDDAYITYRYALNLANGEGLVYDLSERVLGCTAPGFAILLAVLHSVSGLAIPALGTLSTAASLLALAVIFYRQLARISVTAGIVAGSITVCTSLFWIHNGSEQHLVLLFLALAARVTMPVASGLLAGFAVWLRPDALLAIPILFAVCWWSTGKGKWSGLRFAASSGSVVLAGLALAAWTYGGAIPSTLAAKRLQASLDMPFWRHGAEYWVAGLKWLQVSVFGVWVWPFLLVALVGAIQLARCWRKVPSVTCICLYAASLAVAYPVLGVPLYTWYLIPAVASINVLAALGVTALGRAAGELLERQFMRLRRGHSRRAVAAAVWLLLAPLWSVPLVRMARGYIGFQGVARYVDYRAVADWLARDSASSGNDAFFFTEVGIIGYFSHLRVEDPLGLVTADARVHLDNKDLTGLFVESRPRYVVEHPDQRRLMRDVLTHPDFLTGYQEALELRMVDGRTLRVHKRR